MHPLIILAAGVAVVVGGVLLLRLHAFLALLAAAAVVSILTPSWRIERFEAIERRASYRQQQDSTLLFDPQPAPGDPRFLAGSPWLLLRPDERGTLRVVGRLQAATVGESGQGTYRGERPADLGVEPGSTVADTASGARWLSEPLVVERDDQLIHAVDWRAARAASSRTLGERIAVPFGNTTGQIGILIGLAAILGACLLESGAAERIVRSALRLCGERGAPAAFMGSGFLLGIPVFFDTVFYLMVPLGKALRVRTGRNYLLYVLTIVAGATMAHSLVPPTPGPLFVAGALEVNIALMIVLGTLVGLASSTTGMAFAYWVNRRHDVPLREGPEFRLSDLQQQVERDTSQLPPLWLAVLPIVLPVALITAETLSGQWPWLPSGAADWIAVCGNKNMALGLAAGVALLTAWLYRADDRRTMGQLLQGALASGGVIVLITAAGGALGMVMRQTGVGELLAAPDGSSWKLLTTAFLITAAVRTAQGSATVAMITAAGILASFADPQSLGCHPVYLALAIGCGSKPIAWMNDSGFWVICKMSGMTEQEGLKFVSPLTLVMGLAGQAATLLLAACLPLV